MISFAPARTGNQRVGVAHPGTQHSWQTALAFQESGMLEWYCTCFYYKPSAQPDRLLRLLPSPILQRLERELRRRRFDELNDDLVHRALETELVERPIGRLSWKLMLRLQERRHRRFPRYVESLRKRKPVDVLWGPHDILEAARQARQSGAFWVLDQPIGHFAALNSTMREEYEKHPEVFLESDIGISEHLLARQFAAAREADLIAVGSSFARQTMIENGVPGEKLVSIPYGYPENRYPRTKPVRPPLEGRPTEFIFVGSFGPRKGAAYLLKAFARIDPRVARLTVVGPIGVPQQIVASAPPSVRFVGQVTRPDVARYMAHADCFVFPSLFEGGGIVLYEAAACALGIIQSRQCGDGVREGKNGVILDHVSADTIEEAVRKALVPETLTAWQDSSWSMRHERSWAIYRETVRQTTAGLRDL